MAGAVAVILFLLALHCADDFHLRYEADHAAYTPPMESRAAAIARVESACNLSPKLRAHACQSHRRDCEVGRFQIRPSTARRRCVGLNIRTYHGNVDCFLKVFGEDVDRLGLTDATVRYNGYGPAGAYAYLYKVLKAEEHDAQS
jgi:hypothetical protein